MSRPEFLSVQITLGMRSTGVSHINFIKIDSQNIIFRHLDQEPVLVQYIEEGSVGVKDIKCWS